MVYAAKIRTLEGERAGFIWGELDRCRFALLELLVDVKGVQLESVIVVGRSDNELYVFTLLDPDGIGRKFILLCCDLDLVCVRRGLLVRGRAQHDGNQ